MSVVKYESYICTVYSGSFDKISLSDNWSLSIGCELQCGCENLDEGRHLESLGLWYVLPIISPVLYSR